MLLYKALQLLGEMTGLKMTVIKTEGGARRNQDKPAVSVTEESLYIRLHVSKLFFWYEQGGRGGQSKKSVM